MRRFLRMVVPALGVVLTITCVAREDPLCIRVNPHASLQAQIQAAPAGSIMCLPEGTWEENIVIDKSLTLRGLGPGYSVIRAKSSTSPALWIKGARVGGPLSVVVEGVTIRGCADLDAGREGGLLLYQGVAADGLAHVVIHDCTIQEAPMAIHLSGHVQALISNTTIQGHESWLRIPPRLAIGIMLTGQAQAKVVKCTIAWVVDGILAEGTAQVTIDRSLVQHTDVGVYVLDDAQAVITRTHIAHSMDGVVLCHRSQARIVMCAIVDNKVGVAIADHASAVLVNNKIARSRTFGVLPTLHDPRLWFAGFILGSGNVIPGPNDPDGNLLGAVYLDELSFLMTEEGGAWPRR